MWDFEIGKTLSLMARTWPFIALRLIVYFTITVAYVFATGAGAGIGYGVGHITDNPGAFAVWGGIFGFGIVGLIVYWIREYILYMVKAGHIAVLVYLLDGRVVPDGRSQIDHARTVVTARFKEANLLFVLDQLIKGIIRVITGLIGGVSRLLPIPGVQGLARFANTVIRISLSYVDEIILAYNIRTDSNAPFESARRGLVLYAQNATTMIKNAVWLAIIMWVLAFVVFLFMLAPAAAILYIMPGQLAGWAFVLAIVFAWAVKAALIEPFVVAALMQVYFKTIEGQTPNPEWERRLHDASEQFRELKDRAVQTFSPAASEQPPAAGTGQV